MTIITVLSVSAITVFLVVCDAHAPEFPISIRKNNGTETTIKSQKYINYSSSTSEHNKLSQNLENILHNHTVRHHHRGSSKNFRNRKKRCRRYAQGYYPPPQRLPIYGRNYNTPKFMAPNYVPPKYVVPSRYYSAMCHSYCVPCITPTCRRRCPNFPGDSPTKTTGQVTVTTTAFTKGSTKPTATITVVTKPPCNCNEDGSKFQTCDSTGACVCKPNYTGKACDNCEDGYWKNLKKECVLCSCNKYGSLPNTFCDKKIGRCHCKDGVEGIRCDICKPNYYGTIEKGCRECDPCTKTGHLCDSQTGKCVCPTLTGGDSCQQCVENAWGYRAGVGCKECNCSPTGSLNLQCDLRTGKCLCEAGYEGEKCNKCSFGYYGYPNCKKCDCNFLGTDERDCINGSCKCNDSGNCRCKENVEGKKCDACIPKSFGLTRENPKGCTTCFCFGRSNKCTDASLKWDKIRTDKINNETEIVNSDFWRLPNKFTGDLTTSYGGFLTVNLKRGFFTVKLEGSGVGLQTTSKRNNEVQLIESNWNIFFRNPQFPSNCQIKLSRSCFMVVLQNVTSLLIEANERIQAVLLDKAKQNLPTYSSSYSIEKCECPKEYTGLSCQDPNTGYFRYFPKNPEDNWINKVIGKAKACECNGRSQFCHPETGFCTNCTQNTKGNHCEQCTEGYYKDSNRNCMPCMCPTASENNAENCSPIGNSFKCNCKKGYVGQFCNKCDSGYFNKALSSNSIVCEACECNPFGVANGDSGICTELGVCKCKEGFKGKKCNECVSEREYIKNGVCSPCDECVDLLFSEIDKLAQAVEDTFNLFKNGLSPPWQKLTVTMDKHNMLSKKYKEKQNQIQSILKNANMDRLEEKLQNLHDKLDKQNNDAKRNIENTNELQNAANSIEDQIRNLNNKLIETIETLENFETKPVSLRSALKQAKDILNQIKEISKKFSREKDKEAVDYCTNITRRVNDIYKLPAYLPKQLLKDLNDKIDELSDITESIENVVKKAEKMNDINVERIEKLKQKIEEIKNNSDDVKDSVKELMSKINATDDLIHQLEVVHNDLKNVSDLLEYKELEHRIRRNMDENPKTKDIIVKALEHVRELENKINNYQSMFNFTKDDWKKIYASGAYETLLNGIKQAKKDVDLSRELLESATKLIDPENSNNLVNKANLAREFSDRLTKRINNLKDISERLTEAKGKLDKFKYSILDNGKANNDLNVILHNMEQDVTSQDEKVSKLKEAIENSTLISDEMEQIKKNVQDMLNTSQSNFFEKYGIYFNLTSKEEVEKLKRKLKDTRKYLENLNISSTHLDTIKNFNIVNENKNLEAIREKIEKLKNKVYYAKQAADTVNVAMNISNCRMFYQLSQREVFQSLSITFKCRTCQLFKLSNDDGDFNLAVNNNNIILKFNDKNIEISNTGKDKEKTINIEKLGALLKVQIEATEKSEITNSPYFVIHPDDYIEIGSITNKSKKKSYIYNVILNRKKFGLWKFSRTEGNCTGETRDETDKQTESGNIFFNGKGYVIHGKNNKLNPTKLTLGFDFSTFDENSLIYLASFSEDSVASKEDNCAYIALFLNNGYLNLIVQHSNRLNSTLALNNKSNNGRKHHVDINMEYDKPGIQYYTLFVKNDTSEDEIRTTNTLNKKYVFKIKQASHYIGGVAPVFNKACVPFTITPFLGFLKLTTPLTNEVISYGTTKTDEQILEFSQVWVIKNGFIKVKLSKEKIENISFLIRPTSPSGIIMNLGQSSIALENYKLWISGVETGSISLNENDYNTVNMSTSKGILAINRNDHIFEYPNEISIEDSIIIGSETGSFSGGLSNILINNKELLFTPDSVHEFSNVEIGREPSLTQSKSYEKTVKSLSAFTTNVVQNTDSCAKESQFDTIPGAIKFGDNLNSFTQIKTNFWRSDYIITFEFRTFFSNGLIFATIGNQKQPHHNLLKLIDGQLALYIKGRKTKSPILMKGKFSNGEWHKVEISKKKRKLTITVDGIQEKTFKVPKTMVRNEIFVGGIPQNPDYQSLSSVVGVIHPFRGCLKSVTINKEQQITKTKDVYHSDTGQCFSNIEGGAYFNGDGFAIVDENYNINKMIQLSFDFKTTEQNGLLLSVYEHEISSGLSVELQNGAVVLNVERKGIVSNVKNNLGSNFALCNNMWHNVTAMYSNTELTVFVDGISQTWAQSVDLDGISAPVYIAGLPEQTPLKPSQVKPNFKGCMRKLKIENQFVEWSSFRETNNVLLNSCPN